MKFKHTKCLIFRNICDIRSLVTKEVSEAHGVTWFSNGTPTVVSWDNLQPPDKPEIQLSGHYLALEFMFVYFTSSVQIVWRLSSSTLSLCFLRLCLKPKDMQNLLYLNESWWQWLNHSNWQSGDDNELEKYDFLMTEACTMFVKIPTYILDSKVKYNHLPSPHCHFQSMWHGHTFPKPHQLLVSCCWWLLLIL